MAKLAWLLLMALTGLAQADDATVSRTRERVQTQGSIEAYVSPDNLFWHETGVMAKLYRPQPAYDRPHGKRIGQVVMSKPGCVPVQIEDLACADAELHTLL
jgi:hypothetical protein